MQTRLPKLTGLLVVLIVLVSQSAFSQIDPLYAQYLNNPLVINPAYTGLNKEFNASVSYRKQWAGFDGSPSTFNVSLHSSLADNKMGVGLIVVSDQIGEYQNTMALATYSYKIQMDRTYISFGLQGGMANYRGNNNDLNIRDDGDTYFLQNMNTTKPIFGAGIILTNDNLFLGLSVPRMLKTKGTYENSGGTSIEGNIYSQHFYGMASYILFINERLRLKPSVLLKYVQDNPLSVDINAVLNIDERYGIGAFTRNFNTYGFLAQIKFAQSYRFAYAFELPTGQSVGSNFTSHEITLGLNLALFDFHDVARVNSF
jgi:type IX secretion system PorP/SprF family membrane protein